jgi:SAM-dependent methyltransferase
MESGFFQRFARRKPVANPSKSNGIAAAVVPTMDIWWNLTRAYPEFRKVPNAILKDIGSMMLFEIFKANAPKRVLEFGQGYSRIIADFCADRGIFYTGVDDLAEDYYVDRNIPQTQKTAVIQKLDASLASTEYVRFVRGRLGEASTKHLAPESFDAICSTSVLEEIPMTAMPGVIEHSARLLRPGGMFLGTFDSPMGHTYYPEMFFRMLLGAGFVLTDPRETFATASAFMINEARYEIDMSLVATENPPLSMLHYQHAEGEDRKYCGHWTTLFFVARLQPRG